MANLFYPQLSSGAITQYPFRRGRSFRTIKNVLADGTMILLPDPSAGKVTWQLAYNSLTIDDLQALQAHYRSCNGALSPFTFLDPAGNLLTSSVDLTGTVWQNQPAFRIGGGFPDPVQGTNAFRLINQSQAASTLSQGIAVPSNYQYCFSLYARSSGSGSLTLSLQGIRTSTSVTCAVGSGWNRFVLAGKLPEESDSLTVGLSIAPGQQVDIYGVQLEAQTAPSSYKPTASTSGVYLNAHWAMEEFVASAIGPNQFSTTAVIETSI